jgi:hypothetical protein
VALPLAALRVLALNSDALVVARCAQRAPLPLLPLLPLPPVEGAGDEARLSEAAALSLSLCSNEAIELELEAAKTNSLPACSELVFAPALSPPSPPMGELARACAARLLEGTVIAPGVTLCLDWLGHTAPLRVRVVACGGEGVWRVARETRVVWGSGKAAAAANAVLRSREEWVAACDASLPGHRAAFEALIDAAHARARLRGKRNSVPGFVLTGMFPCIFAAALVGSHAAEMNAHDAAGPPGAGKTAVLRALASEGGLSSTWLAMPALFRRLRGDGEEALRLALAEAAAARAPGVVVVLEQMDALRGGDDAPSRRLLRAACELLDALSEPSDRDSDGGILLVVATAADAQSVAPPLRRSGRLDRTVELAAPDDAARRAVLSRLLRKLRDGEALAETLAREAGGLLAAELVQLAQEAAAATLRGEQHVARAALAAVRCGRRVAGGPQAAEVAEAARALREWQGAGEVPQRLRLALAAEPSERAALRRLGAAAPRG